MTVAIVVYKGLIPVVGRILTSGLVSIYETDVVNEFLVRFELENGGKNLVFWKKESTNGFVTE